MSHSKLLILPLLLFAGLTQASNYISCADPLDTYSQYDDSENIQNDLKSEYYVMSYSWSPGYCQAKSTKASRKPGQEDYLQCGSGRTFGYVLHGLWPQGAMNGEGGLSADLRWRSTSDPENHIKQILVHDPKC